MIKTADKPVLPAKPIAMLALLWLVGWTLRVPILSAPPLAADIADAFGLGEAGIGALTMLPVVALAFGAIPAALIIARFGLRGAIVGGVLVMTAMSVARGFVPTSATLFLVSILMGLGVAVFQTALPAATQAWVPSHVALGSAVYLNGMMLGELSGAGLTLPMVLPLAGGDWRVALMLWAIPILCIAVLVAVARLPRAQGVSQEVFQSESHQIPTDLAPKQTALPRWNDLKVWQYGFLAAGSIVTFFVINAYAGSLLRSRGEHEALEGLLLAYNSMPLLGSFAVLAMPRWIGACRPIAVSGLLSAIGLAGFVFLQGWASWISALVAGFTVTIEMILLLSLPAVIARGQAVTRLNAGMTLIGFLIAFILPLIGGLLADWLLWTEMALIPSLIFAFVVLPAVGRARRYPVYE